MNTVCSLVRFVSVAMLGVFAGAMLTEAGVLVPYWRSLPPDAFLAWYRANGQLLLDFFGPLTTATVLLALAASAASFWQRDAGRRSTAVAAALALVILATFFVYFGAANASFADGSLAADAVPAELARWASWHWFRTVLSLVALVAALLGAWRPDAGTRTKFA